MNPRPLRQTHRFRMTLIVIAILVATSCEIHRAQNQQTTEGDLKKIYERLMEASKNKDEKVLREVLTDDYSQVTASGDVRDKERRIKDTLSNEALDSYTIESFRARVYSDSAVAVPT